MRTSNFDIKQGLPDNTINCMAQDNRGFVWTGTTNGLAQFDGLFFTLFRYSNTNTTTISNNNVHSLLSTDTGLYVAADFGVDFYLFRHLLPSLPDNRTAKDLSFLYFFD